MLIKTKTLHDAAWVVANQLEAWAENCNIKHMRMIESEECRRLRRQEKSYKELAEILRRYL